MAGENGNRESEKGYRETKTMVIARRRDQLARDGEMFRPRGGLLIMVGKSCLTNSGAVTLGGRGRGCQGGAGSRCFFFLRAIS